MMAGCSSKHSFESYFDNTYGANNNPNRWRRIGNSPILKSKDNTWKSRWTANPDILELPDLFLMYYRGSDYYHDRIGVAIAEKEGFNGINWNDYEKNPIIDVGDSGGYDSHCVLDPAVTIFNEYYYLYYSAIGNGQDRIGLAISTDGFKFNKSEESPILTGRAPEIVVRNGIFYLFFVKPKGQSYRIFLAMSQDGIHFQQYGNTPVLDLGGSNSWDSQTVTTPRIFEEDGIFYMIYAGDEDSIDEPQYFGLAISKDLINWKRFQGNPIFSVGNQGDWDSGCIWFGTVHKINDLYYLWYEGSRGDYSNDLSSQIGLAILGG